MNTIVLIIKLKANSTLGEGSAFITQRLTRTLLEKLWTTFSKRFSRVQKRMARLKGVKVRHWAAKASDFFLTRKMKFDTKVMKKQQSKPIFMTPLPIIIERLYDREYSVANFVAPKKLSMLSGAYTNTQMTENPINSLQRPFFLASISFFELASTFILIKLI